MCISTIIDEISAVPWDIVCEEETDVIPPEVQKQIDHVKKFLDNPNTNKESFEQLIRKVIRDILEIDAGVIVKVFNAKNEMVEIVARDGACFTKNPDIYGMITYRQDIIPAKRIRADTDAEELRAQNSSNNPNLFNPNASGARDAPGGLWGGAQAPEVAREHAAYFQYGWISGALPIPFGKREIVWLERNPRTDQVYGRSPVEILEETVQMLIYSMQYYLDYFNKNNVPKGVMGLEGASAEELEAFGQAWKQQLQEKDAVGNWKRNHNTVPLINRTPKFEKIEFSAQDLDLITSQKWFFKMVWASFGVTPSELGYTEDSKKSTEIVQSQVFRRKAINPLLRLLEYHLNKEIISEFEYPKLKFKYQMFDVDDETKKTELFAKQLSAGLRTVNEIRRSEGMDDIEENDDYKDESEDEGGWNTPDGDKNAKPKKEGGSKPQDANLSKEKLNAGTKSKFSGFPSEDARKIKKEIYDDLLKEWYNTLIASGTSAGDASSFISKLGSRLSMKADRSLAPDEKELDKALQDHLGDKKKELNQLIKTELGSETIKGIKSLDGLAKKIKVMFGSEKLKQIIFDFIKGRFVKGHESAEAHLGMNMAYNQDALSFIQNHSFENIKGMNDELLNKLRQTLERAIMNRDSVSDISKKITEDFDIIKTRATMISRTELNRSENEGRLLAYKTSGKKLNKKWVAVMDNRTCPRCRDLNGQVVDINSQFETDVEKGWKGDSTVHPNCRCSQIFIDKEK